MANINQNKLYNPNIKQEYLDTLPNNKAKEVIENSFKRFGTHMESVLKKDLYEMTLSDFNTTLPMLGIIDFTDLRVKVSFIIDYIDWANSKNFTKDNINIARDINLYDLQLDKQITKAYIKDEESLVKAIETVYDTKEANNIPIMLCLLWLGFSVADALKIKNEDMDWDNWLITYNGDKYYISETLRPIFKDYRRNKERLIDRPKGTITYTLVNIGYLVEKICAVKSDTGNCSTGDLSIPSNSMSQKLSKFKLLYKEVTGDNVKYTSGSIMASGVFYRMYQDECNGTVIDTDYMYKRYGCNMTISADKAELYKQYKRVFWG